MAGWVQARAFGWVCTAVVLLVAWAGPCWAGARDGLRSFREGRIVEALDEWEQGAAAGDAESLLYMGAAYDTGSGVRQDFATALELYRASAERGNASAALDAGLMFDAGRGVKRDTVAAVRWYRRAAELGSGRAAYNLGLIREDGDGVPRDLPGAIAAYRRALALGLPAAQHRLEALGAGAQKPRPAERHPPDVGNAFAETHGALMHGGLSADAVSRLTVAAEAGDPRAQFNLGYAYEHGLGVPTDAALAVLWYSEAASRPDKRVAGLAQQSRDRLLAKVRRAS